MNPAVQAAAEAWCTSPDGACDKCIAIAAEMIPAARPHIEQPCIEEMVRLRQRIVRLEADLEAKNKVIVDWANAYSEQGRNHDRLEAALRRIARCPNPDSVDDCHNQMCDIARQALARKRKHEEQTARPG